MTLTFDFFYLKLVYIIACGMGNLHTNFGFSRTFRSRLIGQHLSDALRDLVTLTFALVGHGVCRWYRSSFSIYTPSIRFVSLTIRKICRIRFRASLFSTYGQTQYHLTYKTCPFLRCFIVPKMVLSTFVRYLKCLYTKAKFESGVQHKNCSVNLTTRHIA